MNDVVRSRVIDGDQDQRRAPLQLRAAGAARSGSTTVLTTSVASRRTKHAELDTWMDAQRRGDDGGGGGE